MHNNQWIAFSAILCLALVTVQLVSAGGGGGHGHGHGHGHHGSGGGQTTNQCAQAQQLFNQWWPQSQVGPVFQIVCRQLGATQAWISLQNILGVPATGVLDQTTFQALLNNANHLSLAQQLLGATGGTGITG